MITVKKLIEELKQSPGNLPVKVLAEYDCGFAWAGDQVDEVTRSHDCYGMDCVMLKSYEKPL